MLINSLLSKCYLDLQLSSHQQQSNISSSMPPLKSLPLFSIFLLTLFFIAFECQARNLANPAVSKPYTPSTKNSKGSEIMGFIVGPILFILAFAGTWLNEKRAAVNYRRLKMAETILEQQSKPKQYNLDDLKLQLTTQQRLIHSTGLSEILQPARDEECQVFPVDALVIKREVQVKQMRSYSKRRSEEDQTTYQLEWVDENIQQVEAESNSPAYWFIKSNQFYALKVIVNNYYLTLEQLKMLECDTQILPNPDIINAISNIAQKTSNQPQGIVANNYIYFPAINGDIQSRGSLRVKFKYCKSSVLSIISSVDQATHQYQPFKMDIIDNHGTEDEITCQHNSGCVCCFKVAQMLKPLTEINLILKGQYDYHQMIKISIQKNVAQTYFFRLCFFILMVLGICLFFSPVVTLLGYIPLVGGFLKGTAGLIVCLGAILVCIPLFSITMGLAWLRYHPLIGSLFFIFSAAVLIIFSVMSKNQTSAP